MSGPGKVLMRAPNGEHSWVDSTNVEYYKSKGADVVRVPRSAPPFGSPEAMAKMNDEIEGMRRFAGRALPIAGGMAGGALAGSLAGPPGAGMGAISGLARGLAINAAGEFIGSAATKPLGQVLEGQQPTLGDALREGGVNAGMSTVGGLAHAGVSALPIPAMKAAIGNATPLMEEEFLRAGQEVSNAGLRRVNAEIAKHSAAAQAAIDGASRKFDWRLFRRVVGSAKRNAQLGDLASTATESALDDVLGVIEKKVGPRVTEVPASNIVRPGRGSVRAEGGPLREASRVVEPARPLSARDIERIRDYADGKVMKYHEARLANNDKVVGADEEAYIEIGSAARKMLASIPEVKAARAAESAAIRRRDVLFEALKRSPNKGMAFNAGLAGGAPGLYLHDPAIGLAGAAAGAGTTYALTSPQGLSQLALLANRPGVQSAARNLPRALQLLVRQNMAENQ